MKASCLFAVICSLAMPSFAAEINLPFSKLPEVVQKTAQGVIRDAKVLKVMEEREKESFYTVEYEGVGGRRFELEISPSGKILEQGELINAADTPEPVRKVIETKTKAVAWLKVIKSTEDGKTVYFVKFDRGGDNEDSFKLDAEGKIINE